MMVRFNVPLIESGLPRSDDKIALFDVNAAVKDRDGNIVTQLRDILTFSGIAVFSFKHDKIQDIGELIIQDRTVWESIDIIDVTASINSFNIDDDDLGVAIDVVTGEKEGIIGGTEKIIKIICELHAWGEDATLMRLAYHVTAVGKLSQPYPQLTQN